MENKIISYVGVSGQTHKGECVELENLIVAMFDGEVFSVVLLLPGKQIADFNSLAECKVFARECQMHPKLFYGTANPDEMFRRAGGRSEFFAALNECAKKARKS